MLARERILGFPVNCVRAVGWEAEVVKAAKVSVSRKEKTVSPSFVDPLNVWQPGVAIGAYSGVKRKGSHIGFLAVPERSLKTTGSVPDAVVDSRNNCCCRKSGGWQKNGCCRQNGCCRDGLQGAIAVTPFP